MVDHEGLTNYGNVTRERRREMLQCATLIGVSNKIRRLIGRGSGGFWPNEGMEQPMERQAVFGISNHPGLVRRGVRLAVLGARRPCPFVTRLPSIRSTLLNKPNRRILRVQNRSSESVGFRGRKAMDNLHRSFAVAALMAAWLLGDAPAMAQDSSP